MSEKSYHSDCAICKNYKEFEMPSDIMEASKKGKLALFCGAGISTENKNVLPESFYMTIQNELDNTDTSMSFSETMQKFAKWQKKANEENKRAVSIYTFIS